MLSVLTRPQSQYAWAIFLAVGTVPEQRQLDSGDEHTKRRESLARSRHIERRYLKMQEWVAEGKIKVKYINTDENRADMFTKPLDRATFEKHASGIMGWVPSTPKVANTIWVSAVKRSEQNVEKFKARCVYGGRQQE